MFSTKKLIVMAGFGLSLSAQAQDAASRFEISDNACYNRMQELENLNGRRFQPIEDPWTAINTYTADQAVFGVPATDWDEAVLAEFQAALLTCTEPPSMKSVWGESFLDKVAAGFPGYLALMRERVGLAVRFTEQSTAASGVTASCRQLIGYAPRDYEPLGAGNNVVFGKTFTDYAEADYRFLDEKIGACVKIVQAAATEAAPLDREVQHLLALQKAIATQWPNLQRAQIPRMEAAKRVQADVDSARAEADRRETDPTLIERIGDYMVNVGLLGFMICLGFTAKQDRRFKNGYKNNWTMPKSLAIASISSLVLMLLGWMIG